MPLTEDLQTSVSLIAMLITIATAVYSMLTSGSRKNEKQIQQQNEMLINQNRRIDALENTVVNLPDKASLHRMELALSELRGDMKVLTTSVEPMKSLIDHINQILVENARGKP